METQGHNNIHIGKKREGERDQNTQIGRHGDRTASKETASLLRHNRDRLNGRASLKESLINPNTEKEK